MILNQDGTLLLEFKDMLHAGIPDRTLESWQEPVKVSHHADARVKLFNFELLRDKYKQMVKAVFGCPYQHISQTAFKQYLITDHAARKFYQSDEHGLPLEYQKSCALAADYLQMINRVLASPATLANLKMSKPQFWAEVAKMISACKVDLPTNPDRLSRDASRFKKEGYEYLIPATFGRKNNQKIGHDAGEWLVAQYGIATEQVPSLHLKYNNEATKQGWNLLKSERTISNFLHRPENERRWYAARYGEKRAREKYGYMLKTDNPTYRDILWYGDGTKLNYYYQDAQGKMRADLKVYEVIDCYSEVLLGYNISHTEDFVTQYHAYKMAIQFSGNKPYEIRYDNQGGHGKIKEDFLDKLSHMGFPCQPYNGKSKTIESIFRWVQSKHMRKDWFYTGGNIQDKTLESKVDIDFITAHKKELPTIEKIEAIYKQRRDEWNLSPHYKFKNKTRLQVYYESQSPAAAPVDILDMVDMFWLEKRGPSGKGIAYHNFGMQLELRGEEYQYECVIHVGDERRPDQAMREKLIDQKFVVKYDPCDMTLVRLYTDSPNGLQYVTDLEPRISNPRATYDYKPGSRAQINELLQLRRDEMKKIKTDREDLEQRTGISKKHLVYAEDTTDYRKHESNLVEGVDVGEDLYDRM